MELRLEFADKHHLWAGLVHSNPDRVFIASEEQPQIGSEVTVRVSLPELKFPIYLVGSVVGVRPRSERFAAGVIVKFPTKEIEKCRQFLGLHQKLDREETGRRVSRIDCSLPVRFVVPPLDETFTALNISEAGLLLKCSVSLVVGQRVRLSITLDDGRDIAVQAEVSWARSELGISGVQFIEIGASARERIGKSIERLVRIRKVEPGAAPIVIADDDSAVLGFLCDVLLKHGYPVQRTTRGDEAVNVIRRFKPSLVLLDVLMPGLDGKEICRRMRSDAEMASIPVILLSALDRSTLHAVAEEAGASDYLSKPVILADLLHMVGKYVKR